MRKFLVSYQHFRGEIHNAIDRERSINLGSAMGFGNAVVELDDEEKLTRETLNDLVEKIKTQNKLKSVVVLAFSEFDKEET